MGELFETAGSVALRRRSSETSVPPAEMGSWSPTDSPELRETLRRVQSLLRGAERAEDGGRWTRAELYAQAAALRLRPVRGARAEDARRQAFVAAGRACLALGDPAAAGRWLHQALQAGSGTRSREDGEVLVWLGLTAFASADLELARMRLQAAERWLHGSEAAELRFGVRAAEFATWIDPRWPGRVPASQGPALSVLAALAECRAGDLTGAQHRLSESAGSPGFRAPSSQALLQAGQVALDLEQARRFGDRRQGPSTGRTWEGASQRLKALASKRFPGWRGIEMGVILGWIRGLLENPPQSERPQAIHFRVQEDGTWFQPAGRGPVDCRRRPVLRRLVAELALRRIEAPGRPASAAELFAAGWPDQRISVVSAKNRLKVAISTLRKMGFGQALIGDREGYRLDPSCTVEVIRGPVGPD